MKSTVPVGTGEKVRHRLDAARPRPRRLRLQPGVHRRGHCGQGLHGARPDRDRLVRRRGRRRRRAAPRGIDAPVVRADVASAEMIKLAANAALMTRISFINEIANVCEATGADVVKVAEGIGHDRRIGKSFLRAGVGFGGSCFPKDSLALKQLAANSGYHFQVLNAVIEVNELQKRRVIGKLTRAPRLAPRQADRAARARLQAEHGRHARGARFRARRAPARRGRRRRRLGPGRPMRTACTASSRSRRSRTPSAARTRSSS